METEINIVRVTAHDPEVLQKISRQTFSETFAPVNTRENMRKYLDENLSFKKLQAEIRDKNSLFHFAKMNDKVINFLKVNFGACQTEIKDDKALEIERIYVMKEFHGKRVGQLLYQKALEVASEANAWYLWLGVWEQNKRAINFYKKNGFVEFDEHTFILGNEKQTDILMKLNLKVTIP
ncbi:MAG TPA: GNAT family N-acetyltransferase [Hanamia sp.]|jgi:ribosomal protein S18 acetylase RimI-like enzyme|nr:GNAT family N-acetyltransferase [Hanamia sp.]